MLGSPTWRRTGEALPVMLQVPNLAYYEICIRRNPWHVVLCVDSLSSFQGSVNLHWTSCLDDLKPDGRERSENTVRLTE